MDETDSIRCRLRAHGIRETEAAVGLAASWLRNAARVRAVVEEVVGPAAGPVTAFTHVPAGLHGEERRERR
ncbi:hypothetical protein [Rhizohabitans arisaemae]|uniref:hypothetical protein n=1 Tax=Rhizohabitans arisaemae TaxID=2720610 RepID=UPI0024B2178C|nr:hypothetical protein [Rhizohabitans arisaemae]